MAKKPTKKAAVRFVVRIFDHKVTSRPHLVEPPTKKAPAKVDVKALIAERDALTGLLIKNLRRRYTKLRALLAKYSDHWNYEDLVYRFYHQSFKVYRLQSGTTEIAEALQALLPDRLLDGWFRQIVVEGTGRKFQRGDNKRWLEATRPIVEAFFHARYFLEMAVRYGLKFKELPTMLPSGWAGLLCLYDLR